MHTEHPEAYALYVDNEGEEYATPEDFEDRYQGEHKSFLAFASDLADDYYQLQNRDNVIARYFDYEAFARDLLLGGDYYAVTPGGVYADPYAPDRHRPVFVFSNY
jgi:antirestriction protein